MPGLRLERLHPQMALTYDTFLLAAAGLIAGAMNALAGGGSFVSLPALISIGVPSVAANATSTFALFPGGIASSWVYRDGAGSVCGVGFRSLAIVTLLGGLVGSILLLVTPSTIFDAILPWLLLAATIMLAVGARIKPVFGQSARANIALFLPIQFLLGLYGGYFGGAVGLMMLATWSALGGGDIKKLNPMRMMLVTGANAVAVAVFVVSGVVVWQKCLPLLIGALVGGWVGAHIGRRLPSRVVRIVTLATALATTSIFFWRAYG